VSGPIDLDRAFDATSPPDEQLLSQCVHCGFCLPTCPTYDLWRVEMDSPRGRLVLMAEGLEPGSRLTSEMVEHFDACLGCMACVTACPSGVQYDKLIQDTRAQVERHHRRSLRERLLRVGIFALFTHPGRLRATVPLLWLAKQLRLDRIAHRLPAESRLRAALALAPSPRLSASVSRLPEYWPARGEIRGRVGLLQGCVPPRGSRFTPRGCRDAAARCSSTPGTTDPRGSSRSRRSPRSTGVTS
jgi:glycolate oxidase iron-sulfur subunit